MTKAVLNKKAVAKLLNEIEDTESTLFNETTYEEIYGTPSAQPPLKFSLLFADELSLNETTEVVEITHVNTG